MLAKSKSSSAINLSLLRARRAKLVDQTSATLCKDEFDFIAFGNVRPFGSNTSLHKVPSWLHINKGTPQIARVCFFLIPTVTGSATFNHKSCTSQIVLNFHCQSSWIESIASSVENWIGPSAGRCPWRIWPDDGWEWRSAAVRWRSRTFRNCCWKKGDSDASRKVNFVCCLLV